MHVSPSSGMVGFTAACLFCPTVKLLGKSLFAGGDPNRPALRHCKFLRHAYRIDMDVSRQQSAASDEAAQAPAAEKGPRARTRRLR
ncbi:hypothetical protein EN784_52520, partial [bacterium M00.F.Ca.ET.141.01.1.1]